MSKRAKKRNLKVLIIIFIILAVLIYFGINATKRSSVVSKIKGYGYNLEKRDTELMKDNYILLKEVLLQNKIDYDKYAEYLSKLFVIDLYTIDNKDNKYDVGGTEYIHPDKVENYKLNVEDTLYRYLKDISTRKEDYPVVKSIECDSVKKASYKWNDTDYNGYEVKLQWDYEKDLGYDTKATINLIKIDKVLYIAEFTPEVKE